MDDSALRILPGGQALIDWFGRMPRFHGAELRAIDLASKGPSTLQVYTWRMTDKVDDKGVPVLDKHVTVTFTLEAVSSATLDDFDMPGIIYDLDVTMVDGGFELSWSSSYGVEGTLRARQVRIDLQPGERAISRG